MDSVNADEIHLQSPELVAASERLATGVRDTLVNNREHITDADAFYDFMSWFMRYHRELPGGVQLLVSFFSLYIATRIKYPELVAGPELLDHMIELVTETIDKVGLFTSTPGGNA